MFDLQVKVGGELLKAKHCQFWTVSVWRLLPHLRARLCTAWDAQRRETTAEPHGWINPCSSGKDGSVWTYCFFREFNGNWVLINYWDFGRICDDFIGAHRFKWLFLFSVASSIGWAYSRGRLHYSRHRQVDSTGGQQSETSHRRQQAGEGSPGVEPSFQLIAVHSPALQTQPLTQFCMLHLSAVLLCTIFLAFCIQDAVFAGYLCFANHISVSCLIFSV